MSIKTTIAGNWKLNLGFNESLNLYDGISKYIDRNPSPVECIVFPQMLVSSILASKHKTSHSLVKVGVQTISEYEQGAYTGESSAYIAGHIGFDYALIGHSERRHVFHETNQSMTKRIEMALKYNLQILYCVGEKLDERESGKIEAVITEQMRVVLPYLATGKVKVAYEPVWAIGTGKTATAEQAKESHFLIREFVKMESSREIADTLAILYGGSVKVENSEELLATPGVNGLLIGGTSLKLEDFCKIISIAK